MNLYSLHIEKCGGTTLQFFLRKNFGALYVPSSPRQEGFDADALNKPFPDGSVFHGHYSYGAHTYHQHTVPIEYVTMLREPVDRFVSHYYHIVNHNDHPQYAMAKNHTLDSYLAWEGSWTVKNMLTHRVSGRFITPDNGADVLELAWANLQSCALVGTLSHINAYIAALVKRYKLTDPRQEKLNVGKRKKLEEIPQAVLTRVAEANHLDCELYRRLIELLAERDDTVLRRKA